AERLERGADEGGEEAGHARLLHAGDRLEQPLHGERGVAEVDASEAVDLQVDESRQLDGARCLLHASLRTVGGASGASSGRERAGDPGLDDGASDLVGHLVAGTREGGAAQSDGLLSAHGRACSNAAAALSTVASSKRRPTICSPTGTPSRVNPHGTV